MTTTPVIDRPDDRSAPRRQPPDGTEVRARVGRCRVVVQEEQAWFVPFGVAGRKGGVLYLAVRALTFPRAVEEVASMTAADGSKRAPGGWLLPLHRTRVLARRAPSAGP